MPQHPKAKLLKLTLAMFSGSMAALFIFLAIQYYFHWRSFVFGLLFVGISLLFLNAFRKP